MQNMLTFLLFTIIMWLAGLAALRWFDMLIADGGALDQVFGWQNMLDRLYGSSRKWKNLLGNALGSCDKCMSFWFMPVWFGIYWALSKITMGFFITDLVSGWGLKLFVAWVWLIVFWSIGAFGGFLLLIRIRKRKDNGV